MTGAASKLLVIKTLANAFRLPLLWGLFANARFRILHSPVVLPPTSTACTMAT
ncbi:hypothetical protein [Allochromatium palmeri]|uniref:Uncharacterized protein n=1 Tax=Allochromatium palmeri TaxID=231048 RepID=A0A6N8EGL5_9GAMM|nr:hypothetical protein [Allochromatium palmeri]MTW22761.1 hypothetical protein [Allochromatium palmeri]